MLKFAFINICLLYLVYQNIKTMTTEAKLFAIAELESAIEKRTSKQALLEAAQDEAITEVINIQIKVLNLSIDYYKKILAE